MSRGLGDGDLSLKAILALNRVSITDEGGRRMTAPADCSFKGENIALAKLCVAQRLGINPGLKRSPVRFLVKA